MNPDLQEILERVEKLSPKDQQQLLAHLALRKQQKTSSSRSSKPTTQNRDHELWVSAVTDELEAILKSGGSSSPSLAVVKRLESTSYQSVESFMQHSNLGSLKVNERAACYKLLAELLVAHAAFVARKSGAPLSPKLVFNCVGNLPGLFENAFPGYLENGLAKAVILRRSKGG